MHALASSSLFWSQAVASRAKTRVSDLYGGGVGGCVEGLETEFNYKAVWRELDCCLCLFSKRVLPNKLKSLREQFGCM